MNKASLTILFASLTILFIACAPSQIEQATPPEHAGLAGPIGESRWAEDHVILVPRIDNTAHELTCGDPTCIWSDDDKLCPSSEKLCPPRIHPIASSIKSRRLNKKKRAQTKRRALRNRRKCVVHYQKCLQSPNAHPFSGYGLCYNCFRRCLVNVTKNPRNGEPWPFDVRYQGEWHECHYSIGRARGNR